MIHRPVIMQKLLRSASSPAITTSNSTLKSGGKCWACGKKEQRWNMAKVINDDLAKTWGINNGVRNSFDHRESAYCPDCGCSYRQRQLAEAIARDTDQDSLKAAVVGPLQKTRAAEINSCGNLHQFFELMPKLVYSEYGAEHSDVPSEDLQKLSYKDESFDAVFTSDTFEHVPDFGACMKEVWRILKPGAKHYFTIPVVWSRKTIKTASLNADGTVKHLSDPSYHGEGQPDYLVFYEFGHDVIDMIKDNGFDVKVYGINPICANDVSGVFVATKKGDGSI